MRLRAKLILSFLGLAVVPLTAITIYSYQSSRRALRTAAEQESSAMASDMGSRMESVSRDLNLQIERFAAAAEFRRVMALEREGSECRNGGHEEPMEDSNGRKCFPLEIITVHSRRLPTIPHASLARTSFAPRAAKPSREICKKVSYSIFRVDLPPRALQTAKSRP